MIGQVNPRSTYKLWHIPLCEPSDSCGEPIHFGKNYEAFEVRNQLKLVSRSVLLSLRSFQSKEVSKINCQNCNKLTTLYFFIEPNLIFYSSLHFDIEGLLGIFFLITCFQVGQGLFIEKLLKTWSKKQSIRTINSTKMYINIARIGSI